MIAITIIIYTGLSTTEEITGWKEKNIKFIHLMTGILLIGLRIAILTGLV